MAKPSPLNPLGYIIQRQYKDDVIIKNKLFSERLAKAKNLYRKDLLAHYGCVNAIEFSEEGELLVSGGDDRRVLLWSVAGAIYDKGLPIAMRTTHNSNIFCVGFDSRNERIFSGGNDDQVLIHDIFTKNLKMKIPHKKPVYGLSVNPQNDNILATAGDDGRILLFDIRDTACEDVQILAKQKTGYHSVMFNPTNPRLLVTANSEEGIELWDCRQPKEVFRRYDACAGKISGISACFDSSGKRVLALRRRLPPVLYSVESEHNLCQFYHPQYYNSCTMKTCCFAGDNDEYILSGSDDFNLYMWRIPTDDSEWGTSHVVLRGHRSIVNQVRYNKQNNLIASSGVEKMVKLWSAIPIGTWKGSILKEYCDPMRSVHSHEDYITLVGQTGERISHDYSDQSTLEDSKMMAFFDSLIQREIEGWDSPSDVSPSSDSESDEGWSKFIYKMFRNSGRSSTEELKKHKTNRIAQLISKKKNHLAKMARSKSSSYILRTIEKEKNKRKSTKKHTSHCSHSRNKVKCVADKTSNLKYRLRPRHACEQDRLEAPSTSTGIRNSGSSFYRLLSSTQDSDEEGQNQPSNSAQNEVEDDNLVNILPTPLNGTHDMFENILELQRTVRNSSDEETVVVPPRYRSDALLTRLKPYVQLEKISQSEIDYWLNLPTFERYKERDVNNVDVEYQDRERVHHEWMEQLRRIAAEALRESSESDYEFDYSTPPPKRKRLTVGQTCDSGLGTGPSSSVLYENNEGGSNDTINEYSSDESYKRDNFRKKVKKAKVNIGKQFGEDSDSN